jgi:hypothetical protein
MRKLTITVFAILAGATVALAQGSTAPSSSSRPATESGTRAGSPAPGVPPVGQRQPRRSDVPEAANEAGRTPEDLALDRKIKSICRGC